MPTTPFMNRMKQYGVQGLFNAQKQYELERFNDNNYTIPDYSRRAYNYDEKYETALAYAKATYGDSDIDPASDEAKYLLGDIVRQFYPEMSLEEAAEYGQDLIYISTGYRSDPKDILEHLNNTFYSAASGMVAGMDTAALYLKGIFTGFGENWQETRDEELKRINTKYASFYRTDNRFNDNILEQALTSAAALLPSTALSMATMTPGLIAGKIAGSALSFSLRSVLEGITKKSFLGKAAAISNLAIQTVPIGMIEMGGSILDLKNAGASDTTAALVGIGVGIVNDVFEFIGGRTLEKDILEPVIRKLDKTGKKAVTNGIIKGVKDYIKESGLDIAVDITGETATEVAQELSSMIGYNIAIEMEKKKGVLPESVTGYDWNDFGTAIVETIKQTALGTMMLGVTGKTMRGMGSFVNGDLRRTINSNRYTTLDGATGTTESRYINIPSKDIDEASIGESFKNGTKASPIKGVMIGDRFVPINPTDEQIYAMRHSRHVYTTVQNMSTERAVSASKITDVSVDDYSSSMTIGSVNITIETGLENNAIEGFSYYDSDMNRVSSTDPGIKYVTIKSADSENPVRITIADSDAVTRNELESAIFGETFSKTTEERVQNDIDEDSDEPVFERARAATERIMNEEEAEREAEENSQETQETPEAELSEPDSEGAREADSIIDRVLDEDEPIVQETSQTSETSVPETEIPIQENTVSDETELTDTETVEQPADTRTAEEIKAAEDTARRQREAEERNKAANDWNEVKRKLTGRDNAGDVDALKTYFNDLLKDTTLAKKKKGKVLDTVAEASAEIMAGFARASGMGTAYYDTLTSLVTNQSVPYIGEDGKVLFKQLDDGGEKYGWFMTENQYNRYINIAENAEPTTLIHEIAHHFLSVITPDNLAYTMISNVYSSQLAEDGGMIGTNVQEAFAKDLEKYVYLRQSSNKRLNKIFQALYDLASALWKTLTRDMVLAPEKKALFDAIFYEEGNSSVPVNISIERKVDRSDTPNTTLIDESVRSNPEDPVSEMADNVEKTAESDIDDDLPLTADKHTVVDTDGNPVDTIPENSQTIQLPQTEDAINAGEPAYEVELPIGNNFFMENGFIDSIDDDIKYAFKKMKAGKIEAGKIPAQIKAIMAGRKPAEMLKTIPKEIIVGHPIAMERGVTVYRYLSGLMDADIDADTVEFYYGDQGDIYVNLKKDIRHNPETEQNYIRQKKEGSRWFRIPFKKSNTLGVADAITGWTDGKMPSEYNANTDKLDGFKGYDPAVTAIAFAFIYDAENDANNNGTHLENYPEILFSSDSSERNMNLRSFAMTSAARMDSRTMFNEYSDFIELKDRLDKETAKAFEEEFQKKLKEAKTDAEREALNNAKDNSLRFEQNKRMAEEVGADPEATTKELFAAYLGKNIDKLGLSEGVNALPDSDKAIFLNELASAFINTGKSYSALAGIIYNGLANPKRFNRAKNLLADMIRAYKKGIGANTSAVNEFGHMLRGSAAVTAWFNAYNAFNGTKNNASVSDTELRTLMSHLVNAENGDVINITEENGQLTSPLIILSNYYSAADSNNAATKNSFAYAGDDYVQISQSILEQRQGLSIDRMEGNVGKAIRDLADSFRKADSKEYLKNLFGKSNSYDWINSLVEAVNEKTEALKKAAESKEMTEDVRMYIDNLKTRYDERSKALDNLKRESRKKSATISSLKEQIAFLTNDNESLYQFLSYIDGLENMDDIRAEFERLESQLQYMQKKIDILTVNGTAREQMLKRKIEKMQNDPRYLAAREIRAKYRETFEQIRRLVRGGNQRVAAQLSDIYNTLNRKKGSEVKADLFDAKWQQYAGWYNQIRDFAYNNGMIEDGKLVKNIRSLTLDQLASFVDLVESVRNDGIERMRKDKERRMQRWIDMQDAVIQAIPKLNLNKIDREKLNEELDKMRIAIKQSKASTDTTNMIGSVASRFVQLETALRTISPELHDMIFGGIVDGSYNERNVNRLQEEKLKHITQRKGKIAKKFGEIFGEDPRNLDIAFERIFTRDKVELGNMSVEEFQKKYNADFGRIEASGEGDMISFTMAENPDLDPQLQAIAKKYLRTQMNHLAWSADNYLNTAAYNSVIGKNVKNTRPFTMQEIMGIYQLSKQNDGVLRLIVDPRNTAKTNGLTIENVLWVIDRMRSDKGYAKYREFNDYLAEVAGERYQEIAETYFMMENKILPQIPFYSPIRDKYPDYSQELQERGALTQKGKVRANFIEERTHSKNEADLDIVSATIRTIEDQENYIAFKEFHDRLADMFKEGSDLYTAFHKAYGVRGIDIMNQLSEWNDLAAGIRPKQNQRQAQMDRILATARKNLAVSALAFNFSTILQQPGALALIAAEKNVGFPGIIRGLKAAIINHDEIADFVYSKSEQMRTRERLDISDFNAREAEGYFPKLKEKVLSLDPTNTLARSQEQYRKAVRFGMNMIQKVDTRFSNAMWMVMYEANLENLKNNRTADMTDADYDRYVSDYTTQRLLSIISSGQAKDNALNYSTGHPWFRTFLQFTSQLNKQFNMIYGAAANIAKNGLSREAMEDAAMTLAAIGIAALYAAAVSGRLYPTDDDDDNVAKRVLGAVGLEFINMVPFGSYIGDASNYYDRGIIGNVVNDMKNVIRVIGKDPEDRTAHQLSRSWVRIGTDVFQMFGIPSQIIRKPYNGFFADDETLFNIGEMINSATGDAVARMAG